MKFVEKFWVHHNFQIYHSNYEMGNSIILYYTNVIIQSIIKSIRFNSSYLSYLAKLILGLVNWCST